MIEPITCSWQYLEDMRNEKNDTQERWMKRLSEKDKYKHKKVVTTGFYSESHFLIFIIPKLKECQCVELYKI